jgi:RNA polymerase sigma-70 factor (ECF subfamily)
MPNATDGTVNAQTKNVRAAEVYADLYALALWLTRRKWTRLKYNASSLVQEAMLRLVLHDKFGGEFDQRQVIGYAYKAMNYILLDHHRRTNAAVHGGKMRRIDLDAALDLATHDLEAIRRINCLDLYAALDELAGLEPRQSLVVIMRYFVGATREDVAEMLGMKAHDVDHDWRLAKVWLYNRFEGASKP